MRTDERQAAQVDTAPAKINQFDEDRHGEERSSERAETVEGDGDKERPLHSVLSYHIRGEKYSEQSL